MNEEATDNPIQVSAATAEAVVERAAHVAATGMPLPAGLRAAAADSDSPRLARALRAVAADLERGRSLDECLAAVSRGLPPHLAGLIRAARRTGEFSPMLGQWMENRRAARYHWHQVLTALAYPALAVALAAAVFLLFAFLVTPVFQRMFEEFGLLLPGHTRVILWVCDAGSRILLATAAAGALALAALRLIGGRAGWSLLVTNVPLVGLPWHLTGVAEMLRCLGLLLEQSVPLPEALRLSADGITDAYVGAQCRRLAERVERGMSLTMALVEIRTLPLSIVPLVHWGERHGALAEGMRSAAEMIEGRLSMRSEILAQVIPPVVFVFVGAMALSIVIGLFLPLISLIQGLT